MKKTKQKQRSLTAFQNEHMLTSGQTWEVAIALKAAMKVDRQSEFLCFDDLSGSFIELDLSGSYEDIIERYKPAEPKHQKNKHSKAGRPNLGVKSKEVTLLPQHWEWLSQQESSASATLRKLVDAALKLNSHEERVRQAKATTDRFMIAMLGDEVDYENAARALYRGDKIQFRDLTRRWPADLRHQVMRLSEPAFQIPTTKSKT
ncbi:MAG: hypothetical protein COB78_05175 [Hyphomicrobiales bacterium]|nr:MAG: hypothetical protein COB78_05175 [Hyphomicrobiales bacterium]